MQPTHKNNIEIKQAEEIKPAINIQIQKEEFKSSNKENIPEIPKLPITSPVDQKIKADTNIFEKLPLGEAEQDYSLNGSPIGSCGRKFGDSPDSNLLSTKRFSIAPTPGATCQESSSVRYRFCSNSPLFSPSPTFGGYMDYFGVNGIYPNGNKIPRVQSTQNLLPSPILKSAPTTLSTTCFNNFSMQPNQQEGENVQNEEEKI